jgi:hypothetical protein
LLPFFSPVSRVATYGFLSQGGFGHGAIYTLPSPSDAFHFIVFGKAGSPKRKEKTSPHPPHKMSVNRTWAAKPFFRKRFPLAASTQNIQNSLKDLSVFHRFFTTTGFALIRFIWIAFRRGD